MKNFPTSGTKIIGKKSAWELWAETAVKEKDRGKELIKTGCFTVNDFFRKSPGWTRDKCAAFLNKSGLKWEVAQDPREYNGRPVRFYYPPNENRPKVV